ncbi:MAG: MoxR family ATPase [Chloroflexi bacterium]|nr:MoxR family ATPase [Chloroflexota bacterium]
MTTSETTDEQVTAKTSVADLQQMATKLRENIQRVIVGKSDAIDLAVLALLCKGHVLLEDVPGIGKTTLAKALAQSLGCEFRRIQFTPDLTPTDVLGVNFYNQKSGEFEFREGPVFTQVLLADEINRATPRTQAALLEAMQERQATIDGETRRLEEPFVVMATQNPVELEGTFPLPEAQLDRFMVRVRLGYPSAEEEAAIYQRSGQGRLDVAVKGVTTSNEVVRLQALAPEVRVNEAVRTYITNVVRATRESDSISLGASPRAGLALYKMSQARAAINGRDYVKPDDVKALAAPVLAHRMVLGPTARLRGRTTTEVVAEVLTKVSVPIEG